MMITEAIFQAVRKGMEPLRVGITAFGFKLFFLELTHHRYGRQNPGNRALSAKANFAIHCVNIF